MLKPIIKSLLITTLIVSPVFADEELSTFNQQGDISGPEPKGEESYFAMPAMVSKTNKAWYLGMNLGAGLTTLKPEVTDNGVSIIAADAQSKNAINYGGGIYGGVGTNFSHFYIGSELSLALNMLSKDITTTTSTTKMTVKQPILVGFDIIPGYLTQAGNLFYGRLGVGSSLVKLKLADSGSAFNSTTNKINFGWRAGLGAEFFMSDTFSLRTEYIYSRYNKVSGKDNTNRYTYKLGNIGAHQVSLGLAVHF